MAKIAIIDDDPDIVEANKMLLESNGYDVVSAGCVDDAVKLVETEKPDLILLDVMMDEPDDGFYLANRFRRSGINTPIIMFTSVSKAIGFNFGASEMVPIEEFLEKPVPSNVLLEKVKHHLELARGNVQC
jgi:two-component system, OmpR family, response regulator